MTKSAAVIFMINNLLSVDYPSLRISNNPFSLSRIIYP
jgi:hypothetical protein